MSDGTVAMLRSENHQGMRAIVGETGGLRQINSVLSTQLTNLGQEMSDNPRRFGRLLVYKTLGNLAGALMPGGAKTKWVTKKGVTHALERVLEPSYSAPRRQGVIAPGDEAEGPSLIEVDFFTDGAFLVQNAGGAYRLTGRLDDRWVHLRWDPMTLPDLAEYRVSRWIAGAFVRVGTCGIDEPWFTEGPLPVGSHRWRVSAVDTAGLESQAGAEISLNQPPTATDALFSFDPPNYSVAATESVVRLTVVRVGDISAPAAVRVVTSDEGQSAQSGRDFAPVGETLLFRLRALGIPSAPWACRQG